MVNGDAPSPLLLSHGGSENLERARGELRDALGSVKNLEQLLRSLRTGPRALAAVIPDVHDACAPLRHATVARLHALREHPPTAQAASELSEYLLPRIDELESELGGARGKPLQARTRLLLEQSVARLARELDGARELIELLECAELEPKVSLDLGELARAALHGDTAQALQDGTALRASLTVDPSPIEVTIAPGVLRGLLSLATGLCSPSPGSALHLMIHRTDAGAPQLKLTRMPAGVDGDVLVLPCSASLKPTLSSARAAAALSGAVVEFDPDLGALAIGWAAADAR